MVAELAALEKSGRLPRRHRPLEPFAHSGGRIDFAQSGLAGNLAAGGRICLRRSLARGLRLSCAGAGRRRREAQYVERYLRLRMRLVAFALRPAAACGEAIAWRNFAPRQAAEIPDVRQFAPETPAMLAEAISTCVQKEPGRRGESAAKLAAMLGPPSKEGRQFVARTLASTSRTRRLGNNRLREKMRSQNWPVWLTAIVGCVSVVLLLLGPVFQGLMEKAQRRTGLQPVGSSQRRTRFPTCHYAENEYLERNENKTGWKPVLRETRSAKCGPPATIRRKSRVCRNIPPSTIISWKPIRRSSSRTLSLKRGQRVIGKSGRRAIDPRSAERAENRRRRNSIGKSRLSLGSE